MSWGLRLGTTGSSDLQNDPLLVCVGLGLGLVNEGFCLYRPFAFWNSEMGEILRGTGQLFKRTMLFKV